MIFDLRFDCAYSFFGFHDGFHKCQYFPYFHIQAPVAIAPWKSSVFDAFQYGNSCIQQQLSGVDDIGPQSEDCLFLNIFVPATPKSKRKLAVILFIHGGGFASGSGNDFLYVPDFLLEQEVILVTMNYRLGAFGFLSLNTKTHSGNMGLKDQQLALKWTHRNIGAFGGDKHRITLMGHSAGNFFCDFHSKSLLCSQFHTF